MQRKFATPYFEELAGRIGALGGLFNAHLHLDRVGTHAATLKLLDETASEASHLSLSQKHAIIPMVHASDCYEPDLLEARVERYVVMMADVGTTRADTVVDVTADRVRTSAFERLMHIRERNANRIDFRVGAYSPLGFREDEPERWDLLREAAAKANFIGSLPERDDRGNYPDHIGFAEHCRRILGLSAELERQIHIHVDQQNRADEAGTACIIQVVRELGLGLAGGEEPRIWLVHVISPSAYDEERFADMLAGLAELNIGVICCPSAALSMRQLRPLDAPTHNSIARVLEMLAAGVHVRVGSDNVCDITSPAGTIDLIDEVFVLSNAVRYYDIDVMARIAAGQQLSEAERQRVAAHLAQNREETVHAVGDKRPGAVGGP
jgi:cytosine deaminase